MLRVIERILPASLHRFALRVAHKLRHRWRLLRRVPLAGVAIIARDLRGRVLLVRHSYGPDNWALPGGGLDKGESPEQAALRELSEELGCEGCNATLLTQTEETISGSPHTAYLVAMQLAGEPLPDRREILEAGLFEIDELPEPLSHLSAARLAQWRKHRLEQR